MYIGRLLERAQQERAAATRGTEPQEPQDSRDTKHQQPQNGNTQMPQATSQSKQSNAAKPSCHTKDDTESIGCEVDEYILTRNLSLSPPQIIKQSRSITFGNTLFSLW
jgi:hypothetical protein